MARVCQPPPAARRQVDASETRRRSSAAGSSRALTRSNASRTSPRSPSSGSMSGQWRRHLSGSGGVRVCRAAGRCPGWSCRSHDRPVASHTDDHRRLWVVDQIAVSNERHPIGIDPLQVVEQDRRGRRPLPNGDLGKRSAAQIAPPRREHQRPRRAVPTGELRIGDESSGLPSIDHRSDFFVWLADEVDVVRVGKDDVDERHTKGVLRSLLDETQSAGVHVWPTTVTVDDRSTECGAEPLENPGSLRWHRAGSSRTRGRPGVATVGLQRARGFRRRSSRRAASWPTTRTAACCPTAVGRRRTPGARTAAREAPMMAVRDRRCRCRRRCGRRRLPSSSRRPTCRPWSSLQAGLTTRWRMARASAVPLRSRVSPSASMSDANVATPRWMGRLTIDRPALGQPHAAPAQHLGRRGPRSALSWSPAGIRPPLARPARRARTAVWPICVTSMRRAGRSSSSSAVSAALPTVSITRWIRSDDEGLITLCLRQVSNTQADPAGI